MIKAIIFDCFGVLTVDTWHAFLDSVPAGVDIQQARDLNRAFDSGFISHAEFYDGIEQLTGMRPTDIETVTDTDVAKNQALLDLITTLKSDYKIGLLSNISSDWITRELLSPDEQGLFDTMLFSYQAGTAKPDPRIFEMICEQLGVQYNEALMVDDIERNILAAAELGMQGLVYTDFATFKTDLNQLLNTNN